VAATAVSDNVQVQSISSRSSSAGSSYDCACAEQAPAGGQQC
jgi:hypothetical protein